MQKYLANMIEWAAHKLLARVVTRAVQIIDGVDDKFGSQQARLIAPKMPEIEFHKDYH